MEITRMGWVGVRTDRFAEMTGFLETTLGLRRATGSPDAPIFDTGGGVVEVFSPDVEGYGHFTTGPVPSFEVTDLDAAVAELSAAGIELLGGITRLDSGTAWQHFRAPDGNVWQLSNRT